MRRTTTCMTAGALAVSVALLACVADRQPLAPHSAAASPPSSPAGVKQRAGSSDTVSFFICRGNTPDSGSAVIGLLGGRVVFGPHELDVPPGALLTPTRITAHTLASDTIAVQFQPQGTQFLVPATLRLSYAQCNPQPSSNLSIVYVNGSLSQVLELIESLLDPHHHQVVGSITHFSVYAVAE